VLAAILTVMVNAWGMPYLRVFYHYTGTHSAKQIHAATYYGLTGRKDVVAGEYGDSCPLILMIPFEPSSSPRNEPLRNVWRDR
jgi:hypothetical protein